MKRCFYPYTQFCASLRQQHLLRQMPKATNFTHDFSHNDYLGFSQHPAIIEAAMQAATFKGIGSKASRLITSQQNALNALEREIALAKNTQTALIFATGFQANVSVLSALLDPQVHKSTPLVFSDRLNHASFYVAFQQTKAVLHRFRHCDYAHLRSLLQKTQNLTQPKFILSESVFGMDGDIADLNTLISLAKEFNAILYIDEAHATGLFGAKGYGLTSDYGKEVDISMGTFSKALGGSGAYIACSHALKRYLMNRSAGLIYSTAPSPMQVAAMQKAWVLVPSYQLQAQNLLEKAQSLRDKLKATGFNTGNSTTHIIPIILKDPTKTMAAQQFLATRDIRASAIRSPSVPPRQSRLRLALNINHTSESINALCNALKEFNNFA